MKYRIKQIWYCTIWIVLFVITLDYLQLKGWLT